MFLKMQYDEMGAAIFKTKAITVSVMGNTNAKKTVFS